MDAPIFSTYGMYAVGLVLAVVATGVVGVVGRMVSAAKLRRSERLLAAMEAEALVEAAERRERSARARQGAAPRPAQTERS